MTTVSAFGPWVERWLSVPRLAVYRVAAGGDGTAALALYEWNSEISAALLRDLAHVEVGIRNAYDRALSSWWRGGGHWTAGGAQVFAPIMRRRGPRMVDVNRRPRESLAVAIESAGGNAAPPGKVIAELMFGFWRYLSTPAHEKSLWVPSLHRAFQPGTDRREVDQRMGSLHNLRNRVAHHEPLLRTDIAARHGDCTALATLIDPALGHHIASTSRVAQLLAARPTSPGAIL
jgi:hypothetical protein